MRHLDDVNDCMNQWKYNNKLRSYYTIKYFNNNVDGLNLFILKFEVNNTGFRLVPVTGIILRVTIPKSISFGNISHPKNLIYTSPLAIG